MTSTKEGAVIKTISILSKISVVCGVVASCVLLTSCGGARLKARQEQREKLVSSSGLYCEWVNAEKHSDVDVELNLQMAKRCDSSKPFSLTPYKNSSDQNGIMYCCGVAGYDSSGGGNSYAPPIPRRTNSPAARRQAPAVQAQQQGTPALTPQPAPAPAQALTPGDSAPSVNDDIVEDK